MKKILSLAAATAVLAFGSAAMVLAQQQPQPAASAPPTLPHKVALVDMAFIFQNYDKFKALREELKKEIDASDADAKAKQQELLALQQELKKLVEGGFSETSPQYSEKEQVLAKKAAEFETFRKMAQRDFLRKEAELYKQVYLEVTDMVQKYAAYEKYTLVLRFSREEIDGSQNPQEILQRMNKQVVYFQPQDDITDKVVHYLNTRYKQAAGGAAGAAATPAGAPARR